MTPQQRRRAFAFILITLTLDAMGIGLILLVMPDLIAEIHGGSIGNAAVWGGILATTFAVMQSLFGPVLGSLSDRYGRPLGVRRVIAPKIKRRLISPLYVFFAAILQQIGGCLDGMAIPSGRSIWVVLPLAFRAAGQLDRFESWKTDLNR